MIKILKILVLNSILLLSSCEYLQNRGEDLSDCFKASIGAGAGISLRAKFGPVCLSAGGWTGYSIGLEEKSSINIWNEHVVGIPFTTLFGIGFNVMYKFSLPAIFISDFHFVTRYYPPLVGGEDIMSYYIWFRRMQKKQIKIEDYFWIEASLYVFAGIKLGFNILEFSDFILGWFGIDILNDDRTIK